jgi:hypothetical protein
MRRRKMDGFFFLGRGNGILKYRGFRSHLDTEVVSALLAQQVATSAVAL